MVRYPRRRRVLPSRHIAIARFDRHILLNGSRAAVVRLHNTPFLPREGSQSIVIDKVRDITNVTPTTGSASRYAVRRVRPAATNVALKNAEQKVLNVPCCR